MDKLVKMIIFALTSFHFLGLLPHGLVHGATTISLCSHTPYPDLCNSLAEAKPLEAMDQTYFSIRDLALRATVDQAQQANKLIMAMEVGSFDKRAISAWADCLELYEDTVDQLNRSITATDPASAQTWLSAAVTNQETCRNGFREFNMSYHLDSFPLMLSDLEKFLSNSLAINKAAAPAMAALSGNLQRRNRRLLGGGFPEWVGARERKLLQSSRAAVKADVVVAQDGSGDHKTISEAVAASAKKSGGRFVIYVKSGVYKENVEIKNSMKNLMLIGDGIGATVVTGNRNSQDGSTTFRSATFAITGDGFIARDMTFENTAGPQKQQAVALRSGSDFSVFYRCSFKGYQDTLYVYSQRQFYRDSEIYGTVDFVFGNSAAVLQNCDIYVRKPMSGQMNTVTAQGRTDPNQNTGIVVHNSRVTAGSDLRPFQGSFHTYLGRPWQKYSRTVFMKSTLDGLIDSAGWAPWSGSFALSTLYYGEYMNSGAGAGTGGRVKWPGYHTITSASEAGKFTVGNFIAGESWIAAAGVPYTSGL